MFIANLAAQGNGGGLLYVIYEFILIGYQTDQYIEFNK